MSDELEHLKKLMDAVTPGPDASRRAKNLELGQKTLPAPKDCSPAYVPLSSEVREPA